MSGFQPAQQSASKSLAVLCVGNILMLDEGLGPCVAAQLTNSYSFPGQVAILDRATMGMALIAELKHYNTILLVDAVDNTGLDPGTVVRFAPEDIANYQAFHGAHDTRFSDVLQAMALLGYSVQGSCLGVQVANMSPEKYQIGLTPPVQSALPLLLYEVLSFITAQGFQVINKSTATPWAGEQPSLTPDTTGYRLALAQI